MTRGPAALRGGASVLVLAALAACAKASPEAPAPGEPRATASAELANAADAAVPSVSSAPPAGDAGDAGEAAALCPAPREGSSCEPAERWARPPEGGSCCHYDSLCAAPERWVTFPTQAECETSCRCAEVDWWEQEKWPAIERISLECGCSAVGCPTTFAEGLDRLCEGAAPGGSRVLRRGCGRVILDRSDEGLSLGYAFDEQSGELVGVLWATDTPSACSASVTIAGQVLGCPEQTEHDPCVAAP